MTRQVPLSDHHYTARNDAIVALQYLISDQQRRDEAQRQREDAREAARCKRKEEREAARRQHKENLRAEQLKCNDQRDQQFTQLSQLLASLTTLVVISNENQAQLLDRQNRIKRELQPFRPTHQHPISANLTTNPSLEAHSHQADMECDSDQPHTVRQLQK